MSLFLVVQIYLGITGALALFCLLLWLISVTEYRMYRNAIALRDARKTLAFAGSAAFWPYLIVRYLVTSVLMTLRAGK